MQLTHVPPSQISNRFATVVHICCLSAPKVQTNRHFYLHLNWILLHKYLTSNLDALLSS